MLKWIELDAKTNGTDEKPEKKIRKAFSDFHSKPFLFGLPI